MVATIALLGFLSWPAQAATPADAIGGGWLHGGVVGQYFNNPTLTDPPAFSRTDVRINFDWSTTGRPGGSRSPGFADVNATNFSVRWTGQIMPRFSELYTLKVACESGARLYIAPANSTNWTVLLDAWNNPGTNTVPVFLIAGQMYQLKLEYYNATGPGLCRLLWSSASTPEEVLDTATLSGLNIVTYSDRLWANVMDGARDSWSADANDSVPVPRDTNGWPLADAYNIPFEGQNSATMAGSYLLQFTGQAQVSANVFGTVWFQANGTNYNGTLPFDAGYNAASNLTTATLTLTNDNAGIMYLSFSNTRRNQGDTTPTGVANVRLMRPVSPGSSTSELTGTYVSSAIRSAVSRYTLLRWILNFDTDIHWTNRVLPSYSTKVNVGSVQYWEYLVMLANETGKDIHACLPVRATDDYLTNVANLFRYGSDGVNPYTSVQANPVYPPLNPNLRIILEHENEVWNYGFANYGNNLADVEAAAGANTAGWQIVNYDGAYTGNPDGAWLRWHIYRALRASQIFRSVFGDAAMGSRIRVIYEYQYDNANGTASGALPFIDDYFNNADGVAHVPNPEPVDYYFWGGGGAVYYSSGDPNGTNSGITFANASFEVPALNPGQAVANPADASWTFSGTAGTYTPPALADVWTNAGSGTVSQPTNAVYGCRFTVGPSPVVVYQLGRWVTGGNSQAHTVYIIDTNLNSVASVSVNTAGTAAGQYAYTPLPNPVTLAANTTYNIVSTESSAGDALYAGSMVTNAEGLSVDGAVIASYAVSWNPATFNFSSVQHGAVTFGPVNFRYAVAPVQALAYPPVPVAGSQAAFIRGTGQLSQVINFPQAGTYALLLQSAGSFINGTNNENQVNFYYDNTLITPDGNSGIAPISPTGGGSGGWVPGLFDVSAQSFNFYSTFVFQVPGPGAHTLTIAGTGTPQYYGTNAPVNTNLATYFDQLQVISADALFNGGIPGTGQAFGQVGAGQYAAQLDSQARYVQAYGLQVLAYEGAWSLGGDFGSTAFENWCKFHDPRTEQADLDSLNEFAQSGSRYYVHGTYETWPDFDTANSGTYPLTEAVDESSDSLPLDANNGTAVPAVLLPVNNKWLLNATAGNGVINQTGGWFYWNALVPASGNYTITANASGGSSSVTELDGDVVFTNGSGGVGTRFLTKGLHAVKIRSVNGSLAVTNVLITQNGAPNPPTLNTGDAVGDGFVTLSWVPATNGPVAQGYLVNYGPNPGDYNSVIAVGSATNWILTGLSNGASVYVVVVATNASGYSLPSNEINTAPVAPGQVQTLVAWDFLAAGGNAASDGNVASVGSTHNAYGVQTSVLTRGAGSPAAALQYNSGLGAMNMNSANSWTATNLAGAHAAGSYFQFTVSPVNGNQISLASLEFAAYSQNAHATAAIVVEYSTNGFAAAGIPVCTNTVTSSGWQGATNLATLAGISALQNVSGPISFRLWGYGFGGYEDKGLGEISGNNLDVALQGVVTLPPTLISVQRSGNNLQLAWPFGTLLQATNVTGPWITNTAGSPLILTPSAPQMFYRVQLR
jgi:hypothetical protein